MIRLNLTTTPLWMTLAPGMRLPVGPLTTALMSTARAEMAIEVLPETGQHQETGGGHSKGGSPPRHSQWEGVGHENGSVVAVTPDGFDALLENWPVLDVFQT